MCQGVFGFICQFLTKLALAFSRDKLVLPSDNVCSENLHQHLTPRHQTLIFNILFVVPHEDDVVGLAFSANEILDEVDPAKDRVLLSFQG